MILDCHFPEDVGRTKNRRDRKVAASILRYKRDDRARLTVCEATVGSEVKYRRHA